MKMISTFLELSLAEKWIFGLMGVVVAAAGIHVAISAFYQPDNEVVAIVSQSDGKVVLGGRFSDNKITRKNADGSDDPSFSSSWQIGGFNYAVLALAVQADDKIVAGGEFTNFSDTIVSHIARLNSDGSLDTDFAAAIGTGFSDAVTSVSVQADGKILVGGLFTSFNGTAVNYFAKLNSDGTLDTGFSAGAGFDAPVLAIVSQSDGQIMVGGSFRSYQGNTLSPYVTRLSMDGATTTPFSLKYAQ